MEIQWEVSDQSHNINACSNDGVTDTQTAFGSINGVVQFVRFRIYESKYDSSYKSVRAFIKSETILPINTPTE